MKRTILTLTILLVSFLYYSLSAQNKKEILFESFTKNSKGWRTDVSENVFTYLESGSYHIDHRQDNTGRNYVINVKINTKKDFEIRTIIKKISGIENNGFGLVWGSKGYEDANYFLISSNGYYLIYKEEADEVINLKDWTYSSVIKQGNDSSNFLSIVKKGKILNFYINDQWIDKIDFDSFFGNEFGFRVNNKMHISIDFLKINYIVSN